MKVPSKLHVPSIADEGEHYEIDTTEGWFRGLLTEKVSHLQPIADKCSARVDLYRTGENVSLNGEMHLELKPICGRCSLEYEDTMEIPLARHLAPYFAMPGQKDADLEEEIELNAEDMEFSFYHNEEMNLSEILSEELLLALPLNFVCQEECKGLCTVCGANLNQASCECRIENDYSPFAALKNFKVKGSG